MTAGVDRPAGFDPLIAEAKWRMRRRRIATAVLVLSASAVALTFLLRPSGAPAKPGGVLGDAASTGTPFALNGDLSVEGTNGFDGDRGLKGGRRGMLLGCLAGRQYAYAVTVKNTSGKTVTLTGVRLPDPAPNVVGPVATQLRPAPHPSSGDMLRIVLRHWSSTPSHALTVKPGQSAVVQSNFRMRQCEELAHGRAVSVPGTLALRYRSSGRPGTQRVVQPGANFVVARGPTLLSCAPVAGSVWIVASDIGCAQARAAAPACHDRSGHWDSGECVAAGRRWDCDFRTVNAQWCWYWNGGGENAHLYRIRWEPKRK
jgi:hypothetical protein